MSNVIQFYPANAADNPDSVLEKAKGEYEDVVVFGFDGKGCLNASASSGMLKKDILWALEEFKITLFELEGE